MNYELCTMHYALCTMHYELCTMNYALRQHRHYHRQHTQKESTHHLCQSVLSQHHTARPHQSAKQYHQRQPPDGIEIEDKRKGYDTTRHSTNSRGVGRNLPPYIDQCAQYLYHQRRNEYRSDDMRHIVMGKYVVTGEVAQYRDDIGYDPSLTCQQM